MESSLERLINSMKAANIWKRGLAFDVGVYRGEYSEYLFGLNAFDKIIGFEPNPANLRIARDRIVRIADRHNCDYKLENIALSDTRGEAEFFFDADLATGSLLRYEIDYETKGNVSHIEVSLDTIDNYETCNSAENITFIKIDSQGNDLRILQGAELTIKKYRPIIQIEIIFVELYVRQGRFDEILDFMKGINYKTFTIHDIHVNSNGRICFCDFIFVPENLLVSNAPPYHCIDNLRSYIEQIHNLTKICSDRLSVIEQLDAERKELHNVANERMELILRLDAELTRLKENFMPHPGGT